MKHEDLLEGVRSLISDIPADYGQYELLNALETVINLHKPYKNYRGDECFCLHCGEAVDYPCPTIQVIREELK